MDKDQLQHLMSTGWPSLEHEPLGEWMLRAGTGHTGRANSALPCGDPGLPLPDAVAYVQDWYRQRSMRPQFQVPFEWPWRGEAAPGVDSYLAEAGWLPTKQTLVMTATLTEPIAFDADLALTFTPVPDSDWFAVCDGGRTPPEAVAELTAAPASYLVAYRDGAPIGTGRVGRTGDWAGLQSIEVAPEFRRRGYGLVITAALMNQAFDEGVRQFWLQVFVTNPAVHLYETLGFEIHHGYHYRQLHESPA